MNLSPFAFVNDERVRLKLEQSRDRISGAYDELFSGYDLTAEDILNETVKVEQYNGIVTQSDISFYTFCEHHFLPFFGTATVTYRPRHIITGLGKLVRLVRDVHARRLQIQELMAKDICEDIMRVLDAKGARVELTARHLCICSRGPSDDNAMTTVTYESGELYPK